MAKSKLDYCKPTLVFKTFVTERTMANDIVSAAAYGEPPKNVKYTLSQLSEQ